MKKLAFLATTLGAAVLAFPAEAMLIVRQNDSLRFGPVINLDSDPMPDAIALPNSTVSFDVITDTDLDVSNLINPRIAAVSNDHDPNEVSIPNNIVAQISSGAAGSVVGSFSVPTTNVETWPSDGVLDFRVVVPPALRPNLTLSDGLGGTGTFVLEVDVQQPIPEPTTLAASALLLGFGGFLRKKRLEK
ncbi:MAG: PEP-CTERM sorting domain-containing protein [Gloeocapsa sp. DLM2.Bin57]|nr:MAG: PEP-CTERM sorting domain-containing protein [Gloeocapsa sp. DLM2.Bin57]